MIEDGKTNGFRDENNYPRSQGLSASETRWLDPRTSNNQTMEPCDIKISYSSYCLILKEHDHAVLGNFV